MNLRWSFPPYPVGFVSRETLQGYIKGNDPISSAPLMDEIFFALTSPLTDAEKHPKIVKRPTRPRLLEPDTEENLHRLFLEKGWTDGLPIILPTEERVAEMLTGTDRNPQEYVGMMSVTTHEERLQYTVERVAVNAVMAGARPEHFPVLLALGASGRPSLPSSTTSFASMMVVNGPIRNEIGMNYGLGALSPINYANSVIGRAWTLMSINLGDMRAGATFTASTGTTINYNNMCYAENEEASPWEPFNVRK
ncbi:MAG: UGSC family (seleno)protein, partial [Dehalococcoidales bacterium]